MYNVDWVKFVRYRTPVNQRGARWLSFLGGLISPIVALHNSFLLARDRWLQDITVNGQKRRLQYALNQRFDPSLFRIEIADAVEPEPVFVFLEVENNPLYLPTFLSGVSVDFIVYLPLDAAPDEGLIRAFVDRHKLVTKRYRIEYL